MIAEYKNDKVALLSALEQADANLHAHVATYAVIETEWPAALRRKKSRRPTT